METSRSQVKASRGRLTALVVLLALCFAIATGGGTTSARQTAQKSGGEAAPMAAVTNAFSFEGKLMNGNNPANGRYDFIFNLYDAASGGIRVGGPLNLANQQVVSGRYRVTLDFGAAAFQGSARWLEVAVRPAGSGSYTTLSPREALNAVPYALSLKPGTVVTGTLGTPALSITNIDGIGVYGEGRNVAGVRGVSFAYGVWGSTNAPFNNISGVYGESSGYNGAGVIGIANSGNAAIGVTGRSTYGLAVYGESPNNTAIFGTSNTSAGVHGQTFSSSSAGVTGTSMGTNGVGMGGMAPNGWAAKGVYGSSGDGYGVYGSATGTVGWGVYGQGGSSGYGGYFQGRVHVNGTLSKAAGSFKIDHPLDPENKYLYHSFVESPDMKNIYDGNVTTDARGEAAVQLPDWFEALNKDFRYQLTIVGEQFAQARVSSKIKGNRFTIKTSIPNVEVSWQVTGIRKDPYAEANRIPVEELKPSEERGTYLQPEVYGQPESKGVYYDRIEQARQDPTLPDEFTGR